MVIFPAPQIEEVGMEHEYNPQWPMTSSVMVRQRSHGEQKRWGSFLLGGHIDVPKAGLADSLGLLLSSSASAGKTTY